jgi:hypothetical protein
MDEDIASPLFRRRNSRRTGTVRCLPLGGRGPGEVELAIAGLHVERVYLFNSQGQTGLANGLSFVVGLAIGPEGATYVSQLTTGFGEDGMPLPGNVLRVNADGTTEVVVDGLFLPHGIAFDAAGNLYVPTISVNLGPGAPPGQVLRCDGIAHVV